MKFIDFPMKKGESTDWTAPLKSYVAQVYGSSRDFDDQIREFDRLRDDMITSNKDQIGKELYCRYYGQLELLELRVPLDMLKIEFIWHDAFDKSDKTKQHAVAFEKASVLFNMGSLFSTLGKDSEDLKESYNYFQRSAGAYQFIQENFMHAPSDDMQVDSVKAFTKVMVAQAQEAFLRKYLAGGTEPKPGLTAKLAQATSNLYNSAHDLTQEVKYVPAEEDDYMMLKKVYYQSVAHYYNGKALAEAGKYGDALANYRAADSDMNGYRRWGATYDTDFIDEMKEQVEKVSTELASLEKDNDFIYHQNVPKVLDPIKALESAKPTPLTAQHIDQLVGKDLFEKIIPMSVHEKSSLYSEEKAQLIRDEEDRTTTAEEEFKSTLEFLKLPRSLVELRELCNESGSGIDGGSGAEDDIDPRVLAISSEMSRESADQSSAIRYRQDVQDTLQRCDNLLTTDKNKFDQNKIQYGAQWTQEQYPSRLVEINDQLSRAKKSLLDAAESDAKIQKLYDGSKTAIETLKLGPSNPKFIASFTSSGNDADSLAKEVSLLDLETNTTATNTAEVKQKLEVIDTKLQELRRLQKERSNTLADLKRSIMDDDISNLLVLNKDKGNADELFSRELQKFKPYQDRLTTTVDRQATLTNELKQLMGSVLDDPSVKASLKNKEKLKGNAKARSAEYLAAYENWKAYKSGCEQAPEFYKQLLQFATNLKLKIENYAGNRANEANRILQGIQARSNTEQDLLRQRMGQFSMNSSPRTSYSSNTGGYPQVPQVPQVPQAQAAQQSSQVPQIPQMPGSYISQRGSDTGSQTGSQTGSYSQQGGSYSQQGGSYSQAAQQQYQPPQQPPQQYQAPPPAYSSVAGSGSAPAPPLPSKPQNNNQDIYNQPSAYDPSLYSQFGNQM